MFNDVFSKNPTINYVALGAIALLGLTIIGGIIVCITRCRRNRRTRQYHSGEHVDSNSHYVVINQESTGTTVRNASTRGAVPSSRRGKQQPGAADLEDYLTNLVGTMDDRVNRRTDRKTPQQPTKSGNVYDPDMNLAAESPSSQPKDKARRVSKDQSQSKEKKQAVSPNTAQPASSPRDENPFGPLGENHNAGNDDQMDAAKLEELKKRISEWVLAVKNACQGIHYSELPPAVVAVERSASAAGFSSAQSDTSSVVSVGSTSPMRSLGQAPSSAGDRTPRVSEIDGPTYTGGLTGSN